MQMGTKSTIGRVSSVLLGTHEILKEGHRESDVVNADALTFEYQMSLVEVLKTHHKDASNPGLTFGVCYDEVIGEKATKCLHTHTWVILTTISVLCIPTKVSMRRHWNVYNEKFHFLIVIKQGFVCMLKSIIFY